MSERVVRPFGPSTILGENTGDGAGEPSKEDTALVRLAALESAGEDIGETIGETSSWTEGS